MTTHENFSFRNYTDADLLEELNGYMGEDGLSDFAVALHDEYCRRIREIRRAGGDVRSFGKTARRTVNAYIAFERTGDLVLGEGAYGDPQAAMNAARRVHVADGYRVAGVMIHDVQTGERYAWPI